MIEIKDTYFKTTHREGFIYISGRPLPSPDKGPYHFINCSFHPCLDGHVAEYKLTGSILTDCFGSNGPLK